NAKKYQIIKKTNITCLAPGDKVIVEGLLMLRPGTVVNATPFGEKPQGGASTEKGGVKPVSSEK
ncbi:MAG: hypothetical protein D3906_16100, partial [Candidatus Electrothrix sp. AUS1_2]|nr:hypothetical protein [Candidatus Electrothrix sp. AUS1_2]